LVLSIALLLLPFCSYIVAKCIGAGWEAGRLSSVTREAAAPLTAKGCHLTH
jgi:hypothetical protein